MIISYIKKIYPVTNPNDDQVFSKRLEYQKGLVLGEVEFVASFSVN